jgi:hypothetical protein
MEGSDHESNVSIPEPLLAESRSAEEACHQSVHELVKEALKLHLRHKRLQKLYSYGGEKAREAGIRANQVDAIVKEERREHAKLERYCF